MPRRYLFAAAMLVFALAPRSAFAQSRQEQQMLQDLRILQEQVQHLVAAVATLTEETKATNARLEQQAQTATRNHADDSDTMKNVQKQVDALVEKVNLYATQAARFSQEIPSLRQGLDQIKTGQDKIAALLSVPVPTAPGNVNTGTPPSAGTPLPASPGPAFAQARGLYLEGQYQLCVQAFADFLRTFPDATDYAAEAYYWTGMSLYNTASYADALTAFSTIVDKYQASDKLPEAYYEKGECYRSLGKKAEALSAYDEVIKRFPESSGATLARTRRSLVIK